MEETIAYSMYGQILGNTFCANMRFSDLDTFAVNATDQSALDEKLLAEVVDRTTAGGWLAPSDSSGT